MSWMLQRWTWLLEAPLYVGHAPAGSLNRCRLYIPARTIWGAITAEASRSAAGEEAFPAYKDVGDLLNQAARFTYLYPAERIGDHWVAWLPRFEEKRGLCWHREDGRGETVPDRQFRRRLLTTRPGTAIDPNSDSAAEGSLRETECVCDRWRDAEGEDDRVAYVGYVFTKDNEAARHVDRVQRVFIGGDTRYGLGAMRRESLKETSELFGGTVALGGLTPAVTTTRLLAHASDNSALLRGARELLVGWERYDRRSLSTEGLPWQPGSTCDEPSPWRITPEGTWTAEAAR